jgi:hypothetical protein
MLKACLSADIKPHLRLVQLDALFKVDNKYFKKFSNIPARNDFGTFTNFVLNDFRFDIKLKPTQVVKLKKD